MKGRKPDPGAVRRGTSRDRKPTELAPLEYSGAIAPERVTLLPVPRQLPRTKAVKALWYTLLAEVARHELRLGDLPIIEGCLIAKYRATAAGLHIKKHGMEIEQVLFADDEGNAVIRRVKNPMLKEERDQTMLYDRLAQRLGLSPESRIRLDLMQIAGQTMLGALRQELDGCVRDDLDDVEVIDGEVIVEDG